MKAFNLRVTADEDRNGCTLTVGKDMAFVVFTIRNTDGTALSAEVIEKEASDLADWIKVLSK